MVAFSGVGLLAILLGTGTSTDLASLVPAEDYFRVRGITASVEKLVELAGTEPKDGKAQIQQLLALRLLGEDAAKVKKSQDFAKHVALIKAIADGAKAQDKLGFSKQYAGWALAKLTGKTIPPPGPARDLKAVTFNWFPESATFLSCMGGTGAFDPDTCQDARKMIATLSKSAPDREKTVFYDKIEELGNVRLDVIASAITPDHVPGDDGLAKKREKIYLRVSGKASHAAAAKMLRDTMAFPKVVEAKGAKGEPITAFFSGGAREPSLALVGNLDLIVGIAEVAGRIDAQECEDALKAMLAVIEGKKQSVLAGPLSGDLKKVSNKAVGLVLGILPPSLATDLTRANGPFKKLPSPLQIEVIPQEGGLSVRLQGKFATAEEAKIFSEEAAKHRQSGLDALKQAQAKAPVEVAALKKILESLRVEPQKESVVGSLQLPADIMFRLASLWYSEAPRPDIQQK